MNWIPLEEEKTLDIIKENSNLKPQVIFKHSVRCSISSMAKSRLDRSPDREDIDFYYLDLIRHRSLSGKIAEEFKVEHESPQVLLIKNGACVYDDSHNSISMNDLVEQAGS
ncbi:MAG: bacillithiol system redox-active protein YtxJ [Ferruginibacter sp.]